MCISQKTDRRERTFIEWTFNPIAMKVEGIPGLFFQACAETQQLIQLLMYGGGLKNFAPFFY